MKALFDVQKSLELCPPNYPAGVNFKKRVVLKRGKNGRVVYPDSKNPRQFHIMVEKVPELRDSFLVNGYIHTQNPPTIKIDPDNKDNFIGLSGYHRDAAAEQAGWDTMIYDIVEFESPLDERKHKTITNHHKTPAIPNTIMDIVKQVKEAIANNEIENDDDQAKDLISILAADKTAAVQTKIFKKLRAHVSVSSTLRNYHTEGGELSTEEFAQKYKIPFGGDAMYSKLGRLGYITGIKTPKTTLYDAKKLSEEYGGQEVEIYAWIQDNPKQAPAIYQQREDWKRKFDEFIMRDCENIKYIMEKLGFSVTLQQIRDVHPIKFKGFLAQDISKDPTNNGKPKEEGIVDIHGNPVR